MRARPFLTLILGLAALGADCGRNREYQPIVLRVTNWGGPSIDARFMQAEREFREGFERLHPGVRVQLENIPGEGQYASKLMMMFLAGKGPDVLHLDASSAAVFINNGLLMDLTPQMKDDQSFRADDYFGVVMDTFRRDQSQFAIPLDFTPVLMFYNKRLFDRAGVPYPRNGWTWDDFLATARTLTVRPASRGGPTQYGFNFTNWMPGWVPWIWTNGGDVLSPDGAHAEGYFDGPRTTQAIEFLVDLIVKHRVAPSLSASAAAGVDLFRAQRAAMNVGGHWLVLDYRRDGMDFGVVSLPTNIGRPVTVIYESGLAINRKTRHADLAWDYIKYMTSRDVQTRRVSDGLAISGNFAVAQHYAGTPVEDAFLAAVKGARGPWGARVEPYVTVEDLGQEMFDDILSGADERHAISQTARLIESELRKQ